MNKRTRRLLFKWSIIINILFIAGVLLDFFLNDAGFMIPLLIAYAVFVILIILLYIVGRNDDKTEELNPELERKMIVYGKEG